MSKLSIPSARHGVLFEVSDTGRFLGWIMPSRLQPLTAAHSRPRSSSARTRCSRRRRPSAAGTRAGPSTDDPGGGDPPGGQRCRTECGRVAQAGYLLCESCWATRYSCGPDELPADELNLFDAGIE